jgi:DNA-binding response OmpR family regulator
MALAPKSSLGDGSRAYDGAGPLGSGSLPAAPGWMTGRVLVVEPDPAVRAALADALGREGLAVDGLADGRAALEQATSGRYELVILDIAVPGLCGLEGCRRIRFESDVPLLIVSARDSEADLVLGLEAGADDYVGKPFSLAELISRVRALLRRRQLDLRPSPLVRRVGDLEIDFAHHRVVLSGGAVSLTPTEFRLLAFLAQEPGRAFTPHQILRHLWRSEFVGHAGACKAHISNLRQKIERDRSQPQRIVTVRGAGYALLAEAVSPAPGPARRPPRSARGG